MWKLRFFVHCTNWEHGGYENVHYFQSKGEALNYVKENPKITLISVEKVSKEIFLDDLVGLSL